jgi:hypothetical protein
MCNHKWILQIETDEFAKHICVLCGHVRVSFKKGMPVSEFLEELEQLYKIVPVEKDSDSGSACAGGL